MVTWAAVFDGTTGKAEFTGGSVTYSDNTDVEFLGIKFTSLQTAGLLSNGGGVGRYFRYNAGSFRFRSSSSTYSIWPYTPVIGQVYDIKVECRPNSVELFIDGVSQGVKLGVFGTFNIDTVGLFNTSNYADIIVQQLKITDFNTPSNSRDFFNNVSAGSNVIWKDQSANVTDAILVDTATDGSQWEPISGGTTVDGDITLPSLVFNGSATDSTSEITGNLSATLPSLVFNGSATDSTSEITGNLSATLPSLVFNGSATDSTSGIIANGGITLPSLVFNGSATDSTSEITGNLSATLPSLVFNGSATDSTSEITGNLSVILPSLVFNGSATDSTPGITANGDITLPSLVFNGSATDSTSEITGNLSATLPSLVFNGSALNGGTPEPDKFFNVNLNENSYTIVLNQTNYTINI